MLPTRTLTSKTAFISTLLTLCLCIPQNGISAGPFARQPEKSLPEVLTELKQLFDRFGETDQNGRWNMAGDEQITKIKSTAENNPALKDMEDWSYLKAEDCSLWLTRLSSDEIWLYKIPLAKLKTSIGTYSQCDECDANLTLKTEDNEKAIVVTLITISLHWISVSHTDTVMPALSSLKRANQVAGDISIAIRSCRQTQ